MKPKKKRINSRAKGARIEREGRDLLRKYGFKARRGQQYAGGGDSPDLVTNTPIHWEVKGVEKLNIKNAVDQALRDCGEGKMPVVLHKTNRSRWLCTMDAEMFLVFLKILQEATKNSQNLLDYGAVQWPIDEEL